MDEHLHQTPPPAPPQRNSKGCLFGFFGGCFIALCAVISVPIIFIFAMIGALFSESAKTTYNFTQDTYTQLSGEGANQVLRLELNGVIGTPSNEWLPALDSDLAVKQAVEEAIEDDAIRAILLVIDSPGGGITASDELYHALERFKVSDEKRKVVVLARDLLASGGYYVALQADWIRLQPTTLIGSIGVIVPGFNAAQLAQRLGIADNSITSGGNKDLSNPLKPIDPAHNALLQEVVNTLHTRFVSLVAKHRKLGMDEVRKVADGRIFTAEDAVNRRLADDVGYEETLDLKLAELLGCEATELTILVPASTTMSTWQRFFIHLPERFGASFLAPMTERPSAVPQYRY